MISYAFYPECGGVAILSEESEGEELKSRPRKRWRLLLPPIIRASASRNGEGVGRMEAVVDDLPKTEAETAAKAENSTSDTDLGILPDGNVPSAEAPDVLCPVGVRDFLISTGVWRRD